LVGRSVGAWPTHAEVTKKEGKARSKPSDPGFRRADSRGRSEGDAEIAFDKRWSRCNLFAHLNIRNRGPDETYVSTQCSATQKEAWFSRPDANPFWSCGSKASACQRPAANLSLEAGSTPRFAVGLPSGESSAPGGAVVVTEWSLSLHRVRPGCRVWAWSREQRQLAAPCIATERSAASARRSTRFPCGMDATTWSSLLVRC